MFDTFDIDKGGDIIFEDGRAIHVTPHSERIFGALWGNGAFLEFLVYSNPREGFDPSDRIHMLITAADSKPRGYMMNVEDAASIITGLSTAISAVIEGGYPTKPETKAV